MRRVNPPRLIAGYLVVGGLCWGLSEGAVSVATACRLGGGLALAWTATVLRRVLWPAPAPARAFEQALRQKPGQPLAPPKNYRMIQYAVTLACAPKGGDAVQTRLRPLLAEIAVHRLASHRGIDLFTEPLAARLLLGDDLFSLIAGETALRAGRPDNVMPGVTLQVLEEWVERLADI